ncbi:hypothetical protein C8Q77DRAFT_1149883 [Trametes polyzona]|nr:hypothetical protein C8Q77DRAFT_1149883 [Trametes polyzona]
MSIDTDTHSCVHIEIAYHILESVEGADRVSTLCRCALAGRALLPCARASLYGYITLTGSTVPKARLLSRTLNEDPSLGALMKSLTIVYSEPVANESPSASYITSDLLPFQRLSELRELTIASVVLMLPQDLVEIVGMLPRLEQLVCDILFIGRHAPSTEANPAPAGAVLTPFLPVLRRIKLGCVRWDYAILAHKLLEDGDRAVRELEAIHALAPGVEGLLAWVPVIRAARAQLHTLTASVANLGPQDTSVRVPPWALMLAERHGGGHQAYLLDAIAQCSGLRFLHLHHLPPDSSECFHATSDFLSLLNSLLERRPAPLPVLEHLTLTMVHKTIRKGRMTAVSGEPCRRLGENLMDKERYPAFRALTLRIQTPIRVFAWAPSPRSGQTSTNTLKEALLRQWRTTFADFERDPAVVLDVTVEGLQEQHVRRWSIRT